ncbi:MAG: hypothetical protein D6719_11990 [Candidatus Dadabacteria bacterium]|nr:MAG: hypothetical protein D6719_11990 [Candidatus Dadabacteria bacterium]
MHLGNKDNSLSEKEELLLLKYRDNACGFFDRLRVRRLLDRHPQAGEFLEGIDKACFEYKEDCKKSAYNPDLWQKISARIEQEKRAEIYLGARRPLEEKRLWPAFSWEFKLAGAVSFAVLALVLVNMYPLVSHDGSQVQQTASQNKPVPELMVKKAPPPVKLVSQGAPVQAFSGTRRLPLEVDWMTSRRGRIEMLSGPRGKTAIIWVKRFKAPRRYLNTSSSQGVKLIDRDIAVASQARR